VRSRPRRGARRGGLYDERVVADEDVDGALLSPSKLYSASMVQSRPSPVPRLAGVYAWYFSECPPEVSLTGCHVVDGRPLLYVGISPKAPPRSGRPGSRQSLNTRIRYHFRGNAAGSTLRLTLGSLLADQLDIGLRRVGSGGRMTFGVNGEVRLSDWMARHAWVTWAVVPEPWHVEERLIRGLVLPLNLDQNHHSAFHATLTSLRAIQRVSARALPVVPR
jgi:hypothetical protein